MAHETIEGFPLSPQQRHLWRLAAGEAGPYLASCRMRVQGSLTEEILTAAIEALAVHHEILRTTFHRICGMALPLQVVGGEPRVRIERHDLTGIEVRDGALGEAEERPFDLAKSPVLHVDWFVRSPESHLLVLTLPALCADCASVARLGRELAAICTGAAVDEEAESFQYIDFTVWQNEILDAPETAEGRAFWRGFDLAGPAAVELPWEVPAGAGFAPRALGWDAGPAAPLEAAARRAGGGLASFLLAAWQALLWRLTERSDLTVGVLFTGRRYGELAGTVGVLARFLPCLCRPEGSLRFRDLVARTGSALAEVEPWQESFSWDEEAARSEEEPFLPFAFELVEEPDDLPAASPVVFTLERAEARIDRALLLLRATLRGGELGLELIYDAGRIAAPAAGILARQLETLLAGAAGNPETLLGRLELVGEDERRLLLTGFNATGEPGGEEPLYEVIEAQARRAPQGLAAVCGDAELTYGELSRRSGELAAVLCARGVGPEVPVGICLEPSPEMVVALLAVHKAGGAYVPLDPGYPAERLAFLLADCGALVVISVERLAGRLPAHAVRLVLLDRPDGASGAAEAAPVAPDNAAYVIYTSGSTGRPKGVVVSHRNLAQSTRARLTAYEEPVTGYLLASSFAFDSSVAGLFWTLLQGGTLLLWADPTRLELGRLIELVESRRASHLLCLPSLWGEILRQAAPAQLASLRTVIVAGEASMPELVERHHRTLPGARLFNEYGPTEATVWSSVHELRPDPAARRVPIGRPIAGTRIHLLDEEARLVPVGVAGELHVAGAGLARGYLDRPDLTAERFRPHPFPERPGERLYRTGDLARWRPDGALDFLGRVDHQVKIRGFRIELGEIEALLASHPAVREAVVVAREEAAGDKRLVAYVVPADRGAPLDACRELLAARLPAFMVPAAWVALDEMPLTPNGKVDRNALPAPEEAAGRKVFVAPRKPVEEILCAVWSEVLGVERIGIRDDFFALGGHSLVATRIVARLKQALRVDLPVRALFRAPSVEELAREVEAALSAGVGPEAPPLLRIPREGPLRLSFAQERLWFIHQLEPRSAAYNIPLRIRIDGPLAPAALAAALREVGRRHEVLRTTFPAFDGQPVQSISPQPDLPLPLVDLAGLGDESRDAEEQRLSRAEAARPFDLSRGPLLRFALLRRGPESHLLLMNAHHIVFDGSFEPFLRELGPLYVAALKGLPAPLAELPVQYADFAAWQREWLQGETLEQLLAYWKDRLTGVQTLDLPTDRPRPLFQSFQGGQRHRELGGDLAGRLEALAGREAVTLYQAGLAAFQVLLQRYTGQDDVAVGSPVLDRPAVETEGLIGCFVNTLVLRTRGGGNPTFQELLARVRETALEAYAHRHLPFEMLVQALQPERNLGRAPLFQVMFVLQTAAEREPAVDLGGLAVELLDPLSSAARLDLLLSAWKGPRGLRVTLEFNSDLFDRTTADRLAGHWACLLTSAVESPDLPVWQLEMLSAGERQQILAEWNDTEQPVVGPETIHGLVEEQARRAPDALAVVSDEESLTAGEVSRQANRLAHHLRGLGVGVGSLVAVYLGRSAALVPALLGILKSGGAYVPIDPSYPAARVEWILSSLGIRWVVSDGALAEALPAGLEHVVRIGGGHWPAGPEHDPQVKVTGEDLAYVIFTSGSTGQPKGVMVSHRPAVSLIGWVQSRFGMGPADRGLFITSLSFDLSVYDVFGLLAAGGTVRVVAEETLREPERLVDLLESEPVTFWDSAPAALQQLVPFFAARPAVESRLRLVFLSGDWIPVSLPGEVRGRYPGVQVVSLGGATEATVWSNVFPVGEVAAHWRSIPYGRPIRNSRYLILDAHLQPCPAEAPGDLYIGGSCLASGYASRPELTAERFLPDPFAPSPGARLYRTGDRARFWADGTMEFLGRLDQQVKVRGFRVELGEIEAALGEHPALADAVVVAQEDSSRHKRLVAYVVGREGTRPEVPELRSFLAQRLPSYMVPSAFVEMQSLPLTANGKVDRRALPSPERAQPEAGEASAAPRTPVQRRLAEIWEEVLRLDRVGIHENFFEIGGHSLLATRVISRIRDVFKADLSLRSLFEAPTIAELGARLDPRPEAGSAEPGPLQRVRRDRPLPLSFAQQRLWFLEQLEPGSPAYNMPVAVRLRGRLAVEALGASLGEVMRRHESLRTRFAEQSGEPVQVILPPSRFDLPVADLASLPAAGRLPEAESLLEREALRAFNLTRGPLLRGLLVRLDSTDHVLALTVHHIASDGWSLGLLLEEVVTLYLAFTEGRPSPLPELPLQYADYAVWQRGALRGEFLERHLRYWRRRLGGELPVLKLPIEKARPQGRSHAGADLSFAIPAGLSESLRLLSRRRGTTLFMTLLTVLQTLLYRYSGQDDVVIGADLASRVRSETEGLIGFFINMLVLRGDLSGNPRFTELLGRVRETALGAFAHQELPLERLVEELRLPERGADHSPLFRVVFNFNNNPPADGAVQRAAAAGLELAPFELANKVVRFDLALAMEERDGALHGAWSYATGLFDAAGIAQLHRHFESLLQVVVERPESRIDELEMLTPKEREERAAGQRQREQSKLDLLLRTELRPLRASGTGEELT